MTEKVLIAVAALVVGAWLFKRGILAKARTAQSGLDPTGINPVDGLIAGLKG